MSYNNLVHLEPLLRAFARRGRDPAEAVAAVRAQVLLLSGNSDELFAVAAQQWVDQKDAGVTAFRFLLLVIACGWEPLLVQFLLQHHARDAVNDIHTLLPVCMQLSESTAATLVFPVLDALFAVAASFALAYPRKYDRKEDTDSCLHTQLLRRVKCCPTCSWPRLPLAASVISGHVNRQIPNDEASWTRFLQLSYDLDARRFNSKSDRALSSAVAQAAEQQQRMLTLARLSREERSDLTDEVDHEASMCVGVTKMWEVASQVLDVTNLCERCAGKTEFEDHTAAWMSMNGDGVDEMVLIADDAALEGYLKQKSDAADSEDTLQRGQPEILNISENNKIISAPATEATSFKTLLEAVNAQAITLVSDVGDLIQKTQDELSLVADLDVLGIQISFLLSTQLRSKCYVFELGDVVAANLKRQVLREFNSLTDEAEKGRSIWTLLVLAGFCPSLVLREIVNRAMEGPQHVQTYVQILELCPILFEWKDEEEPESPVLFRELQSALREFVSAEHSLDGQQTRLLEFLCALAGVSESVSTKGEEKAAAVDIQTLVRDVILPVYDSIGLQQDGGESTTADTTKRAALLRVPNYFLFLREFVCCAVSDSRWRSMTSGVQTTKKLLTLLVSVYQKNCGPLAIQSVSLQNTLLLTIKDLLEFIVPLQQAVVSDIVKASVDDVIEVLDEPALMLIAQIAPHPYDWATAWKEFATLRRLCQDLDDRPAAKKTIIAVDQASRVIRVLLWKLLWSSGSPSDTITAETSQNQSFLLAERAWTLLEFLASGTISDAASGKAGREIIGRALVQKELAHLMLMCRTSLFALLSGGVLPRLVKILEQSRSSATVVELKIPKQLFDLQLGSSDSEAAHPSALACELPMSHSVMKFVTRSWSLLVLSWEQSDDAIEGEVVLQMARHFLVTCDCAVSDSKSSLAGLLHCFQWVCYVLCVLSCESRMRDLESCDSIKSQLNVSLIRVLHLLSKIQLTKEADASFSQDFVASWIAQLPPDSFAQARNFVSSVRDSST